VDFLDLDEKQHEKSWIFGFTQFLQFRVSEAFSIAGDMAPVTRPGKILAGVVCLISVLFMAMPLSVPWIGTGCGTGCKPGMAKVSIFECGCWCKNAT
jgi:hypothetical protein